MADSATLQKIAERFPEQIIDAASPLGADTVVVPAAILVELATFLRDEPDMRFEVLMDLTAVDYWKRKPRFEVVYHFLSLEHSTRLRVKVPVGGDTPEVESLCGLWASANWYEREVYDMFGITFSGHPDLRRILMYEEFEGHPLRKDYPVDRRQPLVEERDVINDPWPSRDGL